MGFLGGASGEKLPLLMQETYIRKVGLIPELGRSPGGTHGNPLQYSCLENPHGQRSLVGYDPQGRKESDTIEATYHTWTHLSNSKVCL